MSRQPAKKQKDNLPNKMLIYKSSRGDIKIDIRLEDNSLWLNQNQIASLFETDRTSITRHIGNIFKSEELKEKSNVQFLHVAGSDKPVKYYSLDVIISVGYRVNSKKATSFRIWANNILKQYLVKGYALDEKRLIQNYKEKLTELKDVIGFITAKAETHLLEGKAEDLMYFLQKYTKTLNVLEEFDSGEFTLTDYNYPKRPFSYDACVQVIEELRKDVVAKNPYNNLFGVDVDRELHSIINNINQTFDGSDLYPSIEEKAANLLYLIIKDHPFLDGNKRIASMLFVFFLKYNDYLYGKDGKEKFTENAIVTLSLLIASSQPKEKDLMLNLIMRLLQ